MADRTKGTLKELRAKRRTATYTKTFPSPNPCRFTPSVTALHLTLTTYYKYSIRHQNRKRLERRYEREDGRFAAPRHVIIGPCLTPVHDA